MNGHPMILLVASAICLSPMTAAAAFAAPPRSPLKDRMAHWVSPAPATRDCGYYEGLEGSFPPAGWSQIITVPGHTWVQDSEFPYAGTYAAYVSWQRKSDQDEVLSFTHTVASGDHLIFATMGSTYWTQDADFTAEIDGVVVFDFYTDFPGASFEYETIDIDLAPYTGQTVEIAFRYAGDDGADHYFDAVCIGTQPANDTCATAVEISCGDFTICGNTDFASNDYDPGPGGCTGYSAAGNDLVYCLTLDAGDELTVTMTTEGFDDSIYLITDCGDPIGSCVAGDDAYPDGSTFAYTATASGVHYLIADAYSGQGAFTITGSVSCAAAPDITVVKSAATSSDPVNGTTNPKAIPGSTVLYAVTTTNQGLGAADNDSVVATDAIPVDAALFVDDIDGPGSGPILFEDGPAASGLSYTFISLSSTTDDVDFSDDGGSSYTYTPVPDGGGFDANVTHLRINPKGVFSASDGVNHPSFTVEFKVGVQ